MDIRNCKKCKRLFNYTDSSKYCPACAEELEQKFQEVKEYVHKHPGVGIQGVSQELDVEVSQIKQWIREERLVLSSPSESGITCELCGVCITTGRFCAACKAQVANGLSQAIAQPKPVTPERRVREKERMRFLDK